MSDLQLERHTDHPLYCWRVVDATTGETHGYGLTESDAARLRDEILNGS